MDLNKITEKVNLPVAIVLSAIVLAVGFFSVQYAKQNSIERQQLIKLEEDRKIEQAKTELAQKEFAAERKDACLNIYKTEGAKWNNVRGWRYSEEDNECFIRYRESSPKSDAECDKLYPLKTADGDYLSLFWRENSLCKEGEFENSF